MLPPFCKNASRIMGGIFIVFLYFEIVDPWEGIAKLNKVTP